VRLDVRLIGLEGEIVERHYFAHDLFPGRCFTTTSAEKCEEEPGPDFGPSPALRGAIPEADIPAASPSVRQVAVEEADGADRSVFGLGLLRLTQNLKSENPTHYFPPSR
jgi:hypothetical protein